MKRVVSISVLRAAVAAGAAASIAISTSFADVPRETSAIQSKIDAAAAAGGGRVTVQKGVHPCGTLYLKSGVELHLEEGAVLLGGGRSEDYDDVENSDGIRPEANPPFSRKAFIVAVDAHDIAITGKGVIDGQGTKFFDHGTVLWGQWWQKPPHPRPRMVQFARCRNVRLEGVTFKDSPMWTMWIRRCENLAVSGIRVVAHPKIINSDGIDIDGCRHVRIGDSFFSTGDDCVVLRAIAGRIDPAKPVVCEDVVVSNCTLRSVCQGVRIGCPSDDLIRNAVFRDIVFEGRNAIVSQQPLCYLRTDLLPQCRGLLKTQDILFENWKATCTGRPVEIAVQDGIVLPGFGNMTFRNFDVKAEKPVCVHGNAASHVKNIRFENIRGTIAATEPLDFRAVDGLKFDRFDVMTSKRPAPALGYGMTSSARLTRSRRQDGTAPSSPGSAMSCTPSSAASIPRTSTSTQLPPNDHK